MAFARLFCPACGIQYKESLFVRYNNRLLDLHSFCLSSIDKKPRSLLSARHQKLPSTLSELTSLKFELGLYGDVACPVSRTCNAQIPIFSKFVITSVSTPEANVAPVDLKNTKSRDNTAILLTEAPPCLS